MGGGSRRTEQEPWDFQQAIPARYIFLMDKTRIIEILIMEIGPVIFFAPEISGLGN